MITTGDVIDRVNAGAADFTGADLTGLDLSELDLHGVNFTEARCRGTSFNNCNLEGAIFRRADLNGAAFYGARLCGIDIRGAKINDRFLQWVRDDFWAILSSRPHQAFGLIGALRAGKVDGSCYENDAKNLVGSGHKLKFGIIGIAGLDPNVGRLAETWFLGIKLGDTPTTNDAARLAETWAVEWIRNILAAFGPNSSTEFL